MNVVKRSLVFVFLLAVSGITFSPAAWCTEWGKVMGGSGRELAVDVELTPAGGYIVLGETDSYGAGGKDFWVAALDDEGTLLWQKTYGGSGDEYPVDMMASPDGGYLLAGNTSTSASGEKDAWLVKIDGTGALVWSDNYGDDLEDGVLAMAISADGNYLVAGNSFKEANLVDPRILYGWVMKLDLSGGILWRKTFESPINNSIYSLQPTPDGGCVFSGNYQVRNSDFWLVKLDQYGNVERVKKYGMNEYGHTSGNENIEFAPYVALTSDGGYFLVGPSFPILGGSGVIWVLKLANDFSITWQKMIGGTAGQCEPTSLQSTTDGGFISSGHQFGIFSTIPKASFPYNRILMKFDSTGDPQWTIGYGVTNADKIFSVKQTTGGGYIGVGIAESFSLENPDLWILKMDDNGEIPDCPAIRALTYVPGAGPPEGPEDIIPPVTVSSSLPATSSWTVTVTEPLPEDVIEGNGCMHVWDSVNLPRTGQATSFYAGDDGDIRAGEPWPSPRFTDNGDGTVTDQLTGLIWLKDADCLGSSYWSTALSNVADFNENPETYSCTDYDTDNPKDDWRMPNVNELESLTTPSESSNATWLNGQGFVSVRGNWYWSSSYYSNSSTNHRWAVTMTNGRPSCTPNGTSQMYWVWPVRGGQKDDADPNYPANIPATGQTYGVAGSDGNLQMGVGWPSPRFVDNTDGTVTDRLTGLIWLKDARCFDDTETFNIHGWEEGLDAIADFNTDPGSFSCEDYDVEKHQTGWRMPNYKEFWSLMDRSEKVPALTSGHPFLHTGPGINYWTSTTYAGGSDPVAWIATPTINGIFDHMSKSHGDPIVWPVRGPEVEAVDTDYDGIPDSMDNCPALANPGQENRDGDGFGDICDAFPDNPAEWLDNDGDGTGNNADTDDDNDGMPDVWEIQYGLNPFVDNASDDTDGDGFTDLEEYQRGTNPIDPEDDFPWELFYPAFMKHDR